MVTRMSWVPAEGTYRITDTDEAFNPTVGKLSFHPMSASDVVASNSTETDRFQLGEAPAQPLMTKDISNPQLWAKKSPALSALLNCAALCNLASVFREKSSDEAGENLDGKWAATGDPTEIGMFSCLILRSLR